MDSVEDSPLLHDQRGERESSVDDASTRVRHSGGGKSFSEHVDDILREPLTTLTKILLVFALLLLLLTSVFIGLFAGAETKLSHERGSGRTPEWPPDTSTITSTATSTVFKTTTRTTTLATTGTVTATTPPETTTLPAPLPTGGPGSVSPTKRQFELMC